MIKIHCVNNNKTLTFQPGVKLLDTIDHFNLTFDHKPICAIVNNRLEGLKYKAYNSKTVEFVGVEHAAGRKVYMRSLTFVLYKAVRDLFPKTRLTMENPVSKGYFFKLHMPTDGDGKPTEITLEIAQRLKQRMSEIIAQDISFQRLEGPTEEVVSLFRQYGLENKAKLVEGIGKIYSFYYQLDDTVDYFYGPLVPSTGFLEVFDLVKYYNGILMRIPREDYQLPDIVKQEKMLKAFEEAHQLEERGRVSTVGQLNELTRQGYSGYAIKVAEALQEKRISSIADDISKNEKLKVILVAGPSSSGKTTFSKRLCIQLMACGLLPTMISLDDYFVDREDTPRDETGDYDYESIYSLNLSLLQDHIVRLLNGEEVELPRYNFALGKSEMSGNTLKLSKNTVLVMEGIHGLNPLMAEHIPEENIFRIYVSALTSIKLDSHNYIPTTDNRLIRRIVRDNKYRGTTAVQTIARWPSVRRGEEKWIFPYQENADVMFNSALIYELAVLRNHALPLLEAVHENQPEHTLASVLAQFLHFFDPIPDQELPPTSLMREFLGGSSFKY